MILRLIACGSVDDGKSTLIGRLLADTGSILDDQYEALVRDSRRFGTAGAAPDLALLTDGLEAEREQGITIDVAYRFITTARRRLVIADAPGHEQYTRNMATACSGSDLAVLLVDARHGLQPQTRRHATIAGIFGIRTLVLAINKMDLVGFDQAVFDRITADFMAFAAGLGTCAVQPIPLCARDGDNVVRPSARMGWYRGPTLLDHLERVAVEGPDASALARLPVQLVSRPDPDTRLYAGTLVAGSLERGSRLRKAGDATTARIAQLFVAGEEKDRASAGDAVQLLLDGDIDLVRGDLLTTPVDPLMPADQFRARIVWLAAEPLITGRTYLFKIGTATVAGSVTRIRHRIDIGSGAQLSATQLTVNDIASVNLALRSPVAAAPYGDSRSLGGFILIDRQTNATVAAGIIDFSLMRAANLAWQSVAIDRSARAGLKGQRPGVVWFTGLSGAGKSTIADLVEQGLHAEGRHTYLIDGDNLRHGLNRDLGFTPADRVENVRRAAEVAALMADAGLIVLVCLISPYREDRAAARELLPQGEFIEVFVDTSIEECQRRDVKGLYAKAIAGQVPNLTGISAPYERPEHPDLHLRTDEMTARMAADAVLHRLGHGSLHGIAEP